MVTPHDVEWRKIIANIYTQDERPMFNIVVRWLWNQQEAAEVVQEAFMKLWENRGHVESSTARAYVYRTALNLAKNRRRYHALRKFIDLEDVHHGAPAEQLAHLESSEDQRRIRAAIEALSDKLRRVLLLRHFAEMDYEAIAVTLGISAGTVASRLNRGMTQLHTRLGDLAHAFK